jgi:ankyrin repeat protein
MIEDDFLSAVRAGDTKTVAALLGKGVSPVLANAQGHTPLDVAAAANNKAIIDILVLFYLSLGCYTY